MGIHQESILDRKLTTARIENRSDTKAVIFGIGLSSPEALAIMDAAEVSGVGFRQHPAIDSLLESASPSSTGCVIITCGADSVQNAAVMHQLSAHFHSIAVVALLNVDSPELAVELMQHGAHSVLKIPLEHQKLLTTLSGAVEQSVSSSGFVASGRDAARRMKEATAKELEVLELIMNGCKNKEIAGALGITVRAVEDRRFRLMKKLGVESLAELVELSVTARHYEQEFVAGNHHTTGSRIDATQAVKGIEVWTPDADQTVLQLSQSCYRDAAAFREASREMSFRRGEGLPGRVWELRAPCFLRELITTDFVRRKEAGAAGMTTAIAFPIFCDSRVQAVVLILLDSRHQMKAAFESWRMDHDTRTMHLAGGTYINCESLRRLSEFVHLPIGQGLPGVATERRRPYITARFIDDINAARGIAFTAEQLTSGVSIPLTDSGLETDDVFVLLNSEATPMFSLLQLWKPDADGRTPILSAEYCDGVPSLLSQISDVSGADGIAAEAWRSKSPIVAENGSASDQIVRSGHVPAPAFGIAIPTIVNGQVVAVTVLAN